MLSKCTFGADLTYRLDSSYDSNIRSIHYIEYSYILYERWLNQMSWVVCLLHIQPPEISNPKRGGVFDEMYSEEKKNRNECAVKNVEVSILLFTCNITSVSSLSIRAPSHLSYGHGHHSQSHTNRIE